jgi:hypothetical protein
MPDVNVSVMIDGKTVFMHGAAGSPDPVGCVQTALTSALGHFQAVRAATPPVLPPQEPSTTKGPSL